MEKWLSLLIRAIPKRQLAMWCRTSFALRCLMRIVQRLNAPRHRVGAVGAVFDQGGQVLVVEHVFRTDFPWGLPGGWIKRGEDPAATVRREIEEELGLKVDVKQVLVSEQIPLVPRSTHPPHIGLAYYCRLTSGSFIETPEILSIEWRNPEHIEQEIAPFQRKAILLAKKLWDSCNREKAV
jgi:8-oxo-dGTP pyrophosphatase MutT (NUDIX family)